MFWNRGPRRRTGASRRLSRPKRKAKSLVPSQSMGVKFLKRRGSRKDWGMNSGDWGRPLRGASTGRWRGQDRAWSELCGSPETGPWAVNVRMARWSGADLSRAHWQILGYVREFSRLRNWRAAPVVRNGRTDLMN